MMMQLVSQFQKLFSDCVIKFVQKKNTKTLLSSVEHDNLIFGQGEKNYINYFAKYNDCYVNVNVHQIA